MEILLHGTPQNSNLRGQGCTNFGAALSPRRLNFLSWRRTLLGPQYRTCFMSHFWNLKFFMAARFLESFCSTDETFVISWRESRHCQFCSIVGLIFNLWHNQQPNSHMKTEINICMICICLSIELFLNIRTPIHAYILLDIKGNVVQTNN